MEQFVLRALHVSEDLAWPDRDPSCNKYPAIGFSGTGERGEKSWHLSKEMTLFDRAHKTLVISLLISLSSCF